MHLVKEIIMNVYVVLSKFYSFSFSFKVESLQELHC